MDIRDSIASLSMYMSTQQVQTDIGTAVLGKALESFETNSDSMIKLMEQSVSPNLGQNIDISI